MRRIGATWWIAVLAILAGGCDAIVGAACADGFVRCGDRCVLEGACDLGMDASSADAGPRLDGAAADGAVLDGAAADGAVLDGAVLDGAVLDGAGAVLDGSVGDASMGDGSVPPVCDLGEIECDGVCRDGRSDPMHCGACDVVCAPGEVCAGGSCTATCDPPLRRCGGRCIDVSSDPDHCGGCGIVCASGICIDGECSDALAGHVVVVGHDYVVSRAGMRRVAGNAVFIAGGSPARVVVFEGGSINASRIGTDAAIQFVASDLGRTWDRIVAADAASVPLVLADADAFVIYAQRNVDDATLREWGATWARALDSFLRRGGVVVMFETSSPMNDGTWQVLDEAGLFQCSGRTSTSGTIRVVAPADAVARLVPLSYSAERETVRFETAESTVVCSDATGPVVIHRTVVP